MVCPGRRPEDVGSSDFQGHELRAKVTHNAIAAVSHSTQDNPECPAVTRDTGSKIPKRQADEVRSSGGKDSSLAERSNSDCQRSRRHKVAEVACSFNYKNAFSRVDTFQTSASTSPASTAPLTVVTSSPLSSSGVSSSVVFLSRTEAEPSGACSGRFDSDNSIRNNAERCQSSALGRAGSTGSIDVVSRSGLACQIRPNSVPNSTLLGRLSLEGRSTLEHPTQDPSFVPSQESLRDSSGESVRESSEDLSRESGALRWVQALEFQGTGACRADERLRPLLRWNVSCVGPDGRLLVQLGQHFKAKELNMLARCLCAPLVHIRVGNVSRQGRLLRPTPSRGFLSLTMVPGSVMRLSFIPDTGFPEVLAVMSSGSENPSFSLDMLPADMSGRTFQLKLADSKVLYFWQSEKLKSTGDELLSKMKDILSRRPTISQLTGIDEARLDSFASYICSALTVSSSTEASPSPPLVSSIENLHSSMGSTSEASTKQTSFQEAGSFNGETQAVSLPTAFADSSAEDEEDLPPPLEDISEGLTHRGVMLENLEAFSIRHRSSSTSWSESSERRSVTSRSSGVRSLCSSASFSGAKDCRLSNTHDQPVLLASSWSTRTSLSNSSPQKQETSSLSAGLYTSLDSDLRGPGHDRFEKQNRIKPIAFQGIPDFSLCSSLPSLGGESASLARTGSPPASSHVPISPASLLSPYYCPCPLGTYSPPYVPSTSEGGLISPSAPFFSLRPPPSLFPPGSLSFHEFSLCPVQLPVSTLVTAAIPIHSSGISPFCTQPVSSIPTLHKPAPYMVRTSAVSGYSNTSAEGLEKSFYSCLRARQAMHDESCSVNLSTSSCPGPSAWPAPNKIEAFMPVFDPSLSLNASAPCTNTSTENSTQTRRPFLDRNVHGTPGPYGSCDYGLNTHTHRVSTFRDMNQMTPFELGFRYTSRLEKENYEASTLGMVDQISSIGDIKFEQTSLFSNMALRKSSRIGGQILHSPESSARGESRTGESHPSFRPESAEDLSHVDVKDMAAKKSKHTDET
ncbi:hypothetical protein MPTK1_1g09280 [Marchantia polymorpha subsp. ruderalis]|uniref:Uncharacterized protein n=2 Tax=Marchantia polymorpha TaxID=3197 RepID=A0AAF6AN80_MARPO|nr:hypothetical protein MARPO_0096s0071 [Marchantia polymorpha]BBM97900.1 hypothetical protein Mp_1g09280 [Marchantia polymorpha subsp. ruderalis]|eukprot:PTQ32728.1 hypothetical protein MARPO_0096s0071 [Marchantia polymorpha]